MRIPEYLGFSKIEEKTKGITSYPVSHGISQISRHSLYYKEVRFSLAPRTRNPISMGLVAKPLCKIAYYFCWLARRETLSLSDLLIIGNIGFHVKISYEKGE